MMMMMLMRIIIIIIIIVSKTDRYGHDCYSRAAVTAVLIPTALANGAKPLHRLIRENTMNASLGLVKWNKVHFRVRRFVNANQPLVISYFCYGHPLHSDGMGI